MARITPRLPVHSSSYPDPDWSPTENQFRDLEGLLGGVSFSEEARAALVSACRAYLHWRRVEIEAVMRSEALDIWRGTKTASGKTKEVGLRDAVMRMIEVGEGSYPPFTEAGRFVSGTFFDGLDGLAIQLTERDIEPSTLDPLQSKGHVPVKDLHLNITSDLLMRLAGVFRVALARAENELANLGDGFMPRQALPDWIRDMRGWAKDRGFQHAPGPSNGASAFSAFLFGLHNMFPAKPLAAGRKSDMEGEPEAEVKTVDAMNERVRRAVYVANTSQKK